MAAHGPPLPFRDGHEHLLAELKWLNLLLLREVVRFRIAHPGPPGGFQGLYIGDADVDRLLSDALAGGAPPPVGSDAEALIGRLTARAEAARAETDARIAVSRETGTPLPWHRLAARFGLTVFDQAMLLVACAPDLDARYETLYAYLHDDITRRRPTVGLGLSLLCVGLEEGWRYHERLAAGSPLVREGLLRIEDGLPFLSRPLRVDDRILDELTGVPRAVDTRLSGLVTIRDCATAEQAPAGGDTRRYIEALARLWGGAADGSGTRGYQPLALFEGRYGAGTSAAAAALAAALGRPVLEMNIAGLLNGGVAVLETCALLRREALLHGALLVLTGAQALGREEPRSLEARAAFEPLLRAPPAPMVLACTGPAELGRLFPGVRLLRVPFPIPPFVERLSHWQGALAAEGLRAGPEDVQQVATTFALSPGQIADAAATTAHLAALHGDMATAEDLRAAARAHSHHGLSALARKIGPVYTWADIVLPGATLRQIEEIAAAARHRERVLGEWGFGRRLPRGRGLNALFSGPSGTGKTMAAEVLAHEIGLDLYKIDLATVISKWIGETEKNLKRIFEEAQDSNAVLFFDEADALFGKRSEVRDSHDRYANIEVAYLLQLIEEYEGIAILATNLSKNVDDAFARRMQYVVEFPFPDETMRSEIWRRTFPREAPLAADVDFTFLARQFELAGGHIKGAALAAAVLGAADGGMITMDHLALAIGREYQKLGRMPSQGEFGPYYGEVLGRLGHGR